ncbi:MAG: DUF3365 domain-containing protein [Desulfobulbaceae bacterium]|nr:DUF3365 domain-containing protein [Desulfobulbaceae bacterium]
MKVQSSNTMLTSKNLVGLKWLIYISWSVIIMLTAIFVIKENSATTVKLYRSEALALFNKDISLRKWITMHGGIYVPPSQLTPPNPYLSHLPERDIVTTDGKKLTLMNPAYAFRQLSEMFSKDYGISSHITSLEPIRPENAPDQWERTALQEFENGAKEYSTVSTVNGKPFFRFMQPLFAEKECLKCHSSQGYQVGDIRGGIGITLPLDKYRNAERHEMHLIISIACLLWCLGLLGTSVSFRQLTFSLQAHEAAENELIRKEERQREIFDSVQVGILIIDQPTFTIEYINPAALAMSGYSKEDLMGKSCRGSMCPGKTGSCFTWENMEILTNRETILPRADGTTLAIIKTIKQVETENGAKLIESFVDISKLKKNQVLLDTHASRTTEINQLQMRLLAPAKLEDKLAMICESLVTNFDLYFCRIWLKGPKDKCRAGCHHAGSALEEQYCINSSACLHLKASAGRYTNLDGEYGRIPLGALKIGQLSEGQQRKILTNHATTDPRIHNHQWARENELISFAGYKIVDQRYKSIGVLAMFAQHKLDNDDDVHLSRITEVISQVIMTEKTVAELAQALRNAERLNKLSMGREKRIIEMKREINEFLIASGHPPKYKGVSSLNHE